MVSSLLGPGGPALNVSGSESIRLSGTSNWTNQQIGLLGQKRSLFPSLDMQQDLDIRLEGQLSDRVKVNLLQNSANQIPLSNRIAINYKGDEDDLVQELDLGNTSLSLPGTQYVSYSGMNEGLFGVKLATRIGPLDFTRAGQQAGGPQRARVVLGRRVGRASSSIADLEYEKGRYFLLYDPLRRRHALQHRRHARSSIFRDDANYGNDINPVLGKAMVDPDAGAMRAAACPAAAQDTAAVRGRVRPAEAGRTTTRSCPTTTCSRTASRSRSSGSSSRSTGDMCLAATYTAHAGVDAPGVALGPPIAVGGTCPASGRGHDSGRTVLKLLRAPRTLLQRGRSEQRDDVRVRRHRPRSTPCASWS